ncbi:MAG: bifunctional glutamate N-acetyltransferase/amino-acid acetyltransferase ArgJ [Deltaproteobacteria bacterium]|nr:bifunctional glutamate N-acetyltransferase/amino-acid acetyltransferase ArgJ [Deltaproteobacteria bacterium]
MIDEVTGFKAAAVRAGLKKQLDKTDMGVIFSDTPATAAAVFTTSRVKAAPVQLSMSRIVSGQCRAVLINAGNANACTGPEGLRDAEELTALLADRLHLEAGLVLAASTGVIGARLNKEAMTAAIPKLVESLHPAGLTEVAEAMMTTDTVKKTVFKEIDLGGVPVRMFGMVKGAGMIRPDMATMLCFVVTDAAVETGFLNRVLREAVDASFHRITVDGDTSTNDTVLVMANGRCDGPVIDGTSGSVGLQFGRMLQETLVELAEMVVKDGEGATKLVRIILQGARDAAQAKAAAMTVAESSLVKTAIFGQDANWGRIMAALGRSGAEFDPEMTDIMFDQVKLVSQGRWAGAEAERAATQVLQQPELTITIDIKAGPAAFTALTCDLSIDYIKINADYRS